MQKKSENPEAAVLVSIDFGDEDYRESLEELRLLAETAGVCVAATVEAKRQRPDAALFAGSGKVWDQLAMVVRQTVRLTALNCCLPCLWFAGWVFMPRQRTLFLEEVKGC